MIHEVIAMLTTISKGMQITIPATIREVLGLGAGSRVEIERTGKKIIIKPIEDDIEAVLAASKRWKAKHPEMTAEEMDALNERMFR